MAEERPSIDQTFMDVAWTWAERATCQRLHVGAVLARDGRAISSGYNGAPPGMSHCGHPKNSTERCTNASHAETNVIAFAARHGVSTLGSTLYVTHSPCLNCSGLLIAAGIERVVFSWLYTSDDYAGIKRLVEGGIDVSKFGDATFRIPW